MHYFALLLGEPTTPLTPDEQAAGTAAYQAFHAKAASAIRGRLRCRSRANAPVLGRGVFR